MKRSRVGVGCAAILPFVLALGALLLGSPPEAAAQTRGSKAKKAETGPALFVAEKGRFRVLVDGVEVGSEEFKVSASGSEWVAEGKAEVRPAGGAATQVNSRLRLTPDGVPLRYEWSAKADKKASATLEFQEGAVRAEVLREGAEPHQQGFIFPSPRIVVLDNNFYHHYAILARLYDWKARGLQTFPVLIPQELTPGSINVESLGAQELKGTKLEVLRVKSPDLEIDLYLDGARLVRITVPSAKAEIIRE